MKTGDLVMCVACHDNKSVIGKVGTIDAVALTNVVVHFNDYTVNGWGEDRQRWGISKTNLVLAKDQFIKRYIILLNEQKL